MTTSFDEQIQRYSTGHRRAALDRLLDDLTASGLPQLPDADAALRKRIADLDRQLEAAFGEGVYWAITRNQRFTHHRDSHKATDECWWCVVLAARPLTCKANTPEGAVAAVLSKQREAERRDPERFDGLS